MLFAIIQLPNLKLDAEEFKHRSITLRANVWVISMGVEGDLQIGSGSDMFDVGIVYREIYSYEQFYNEVVKVMESGAGPIPKRGGCEGTVDISVKPMDPRVIYDPHMPKDPNDPARTDPLRVSIAFPYDATELWNGLLRKLLPAMVAAKPDQVSGLLERYSPFIKVEDGDSFDVPRLGPRMVGTREERVTQVMASLTPEQRVALGHPAEYPPSKQRKGRVSGIEESEHSRADLEVGKSVVDESSDRRSSDGQAHKKFPIKAWVVVVFSLTLLMLVWIMGKRRSR